MSSNCCSSGSETRSKLVGGSWLREPGVVENRPSAGGAIGELDGCSSVFDEDTEVLGA